MKIIYTESGAKALAEYQTNQANLLVEQIASRKYVFGDDLLEITASDIKEAADRRLYREKAIIRRTPLRLIGQLYFTFGILAVAIGLYYDRIKSMVSENPTQLMIFGVGIFMTIFGLYFSMRARERERAQARLEEFEFRKSPNQTLEPTTMAVTPPASQEPRQP